MKEVYLYVTVHIPCIPYRVVHTLAGIIWKSFENSRVSWYHIFTNVNNKKNVFNSIYKGRSHKWTLNYRIESCFLEFIQDTGSYGQILPEVPLTTKFTVACFHFRYIIGKKIHSSFIFLNPRIIIYAIDILTRKLNMKHKTLSKKCVVV